MVRKIQIPGYPEYSAGSDGVIYSAWKRIGPPDQWAVSNDWTPMTPQIKKKGTCRYPMVGLKRNGKQSWFTVHSLVALAWHGPRPEGMECCHEDNNILNSAPDNLSYKTKSENDDDRRLNSLMRMFTRLYEDS